MDPQILHAQIDPNGRCNAGCWFCPVSRLPNPERGARSMPIELFERIIAELCAARGGLVAARFDHIYTAHFNEVLLYVHFPALLEVLRRYGIGTTILSNGTPLTRARTDLIQRYQDVVRSVCLNVPTIDPALWPQYTGMSPRLLSVLLDQIDYFLAELPEFVHGQRFSIQVNGIDAWSSFSRGGRVDLGDAAPAIDVRPGGLDAQRAQLAARFPGVHIDRVRQLHDRAGQLHELGVLSNRRWVERVIRRGRARVVGCRNMEGGRPDGWVHVNAAGDVFLCCNDYHFEHCYGNLTDSSLAEIWTGARRREVIAAAYATICTRCVDATWA